MRCVYPNGAAFVLDLKPSHVAGWGEASDATVLPLWRDRLVGVAAPRLPALATAAWRTLYPSAGAAWLAPVHHWAADLEHGDGRVGAWLRDVAGIEAAAPLQRRSRADALSFAPDEQAAFEAALGGLLSALGKSDFALLLPGEAVACTVHHHGQLWWQCDVPDRATSLIELAR